MAADEERDGVELEDMTRISVRVPMALRDEIYEIGKVRHIKPTQYAAVCLAMGHSLMSRMLNPEQYLPTATVAELVDQGSEPTDRELQTLASVGVR